MEKEKYIPSPEEVEKAEGMMTDEQKKGSEEREINFSAGQERGKNEILELSREEVGEKKIENLKKLAPETYEFLKNNLNNDSFNELMHHSLLFIHDKIGQSYEFDKIIDDLSRANIEIKTFEFTPIGLYDEEKFKSDIDKIAEKYSGAKVEVSKVGRTAGAWAEYERNRKLSYEKIKGELVDYVRKSGLSCFDL